MKLLALLPARGGSKRLPGKNVRFLGGKPLITWSLDVVKGLPEIADILVTTDDEQIAQIARAWGAMVPWLRPAALATDEATSADACIHALDWYESVHGPVDGILLLQPTSPFRGRANVIRGIDLFRSHQQRRVVAISPAESHPMWCFKLEGERALPFIEGKGLQTRSQDLPPAYVVNGALYLISPQDLRGSGSFYSPDMVPMTIENSAQSIDIDTERDWKVAEAILAEGLE
jgi:N-acylneuraminate cytidylyltransferase